MINQSLNITSFVSLYFVLINRFSNIHATLLKCMRNGIETCTYHQQ